MKRYVLLGHARLMIPIPRGLWQRRIARGVEQVPAALGFLSEDHHRVRDLVVTEIARRSKPLAPSFIAEKLALPLDRVATILDELEKGLFFLFRDSAGSVAWAYPVTAEPTPHRITFNTGEEGFAA